jgi:hypothetical protein
MCLKPVSPWFYLWSLQKASMNRLEVSGVEGRHGFLMDLGIDCVSTAVRAGMTRAGLAASRESHVVCRPCPH